MPPYAGIVSNLYSASRTPLNNPPRDPQPFAISISDFPQFLRRPPYRPQTLGPLSQPRLVVRDAYVDDVIVLAPRTTRLRLPGNGFYDELDGFQAPA